MRSPNERLERIAGRARDRFPDYMIDAVYSTCWPTYRIRLTASVLKESSLSTVAHYILQLVGNGVRELDELVRLLCLPENYVVGGGAELLRALLVEQGADQRLKLTEKGEDAIKNDGRVEILQTVQIVVPFDPLTRRVPHIGVDALVKQDTVRDEQLFTIQYAGAKPGPRDLLLEDVKRYQRDDVSDRRINGDIIDISDIVNRNIRLQYRNDITIAKLSHPDTGEPVFLAYGGYRYLEEETDCLQHLAERGIDLVPGEFERGIPPWESAPTISHEEEVILKEIDDLDRAADSARQEDAQAALDERVDCHTKQEGRAPRATMSDKVSSLVEQITAAETKLDKITDGAVRLIKTEEHHDLLLDGIDRAIDELTLVSAWIDPYAFDDKMRRKLAAAMKRGVRVRIAWGLDMNSKYTESYRNKNKGKKALKMLRRLLGKEAERLTVKTIDTHEKFIICDDKFCAWGSFNWLSYGRRQDRGYSRKTSVYSTRKDEIDHWKENASVLFQTDSG